MFPQQDAPKAPKNEQKIYARVDSTSYDTSSFYVTVSFCVDQKVVSKKTYALNNGQNEKYLASLVKDDLKALQKNIDMCSRIEGEFAKEIDMTNVESIQEKKDREDAEFVKASMKPGAFISSGGTANSPTVENMLNSK